MHRRRWLRVLSLVCGVLRTGALSKERADRSEQGVVNTDMICLSGGHRPIRLKYLPLLEGGNFGCCHCEGSSASKFSSVVAKFSGVPAIICHIVTCGEIECQ